MDSPAPPDSLFALPDELLERVLLDLDPWDLAAVSETCRTLRDTVTTNPAVRYHALLEERGYLDVPVRREAVVAARAREAEAEATDIPVSTTDTTAAATSVPASTTDNGTANTADAPTPSSSRAPKRARPETMFETAIKSPHTGRARPTVPSVTLAPWNAKPPSTRADYSFLSISGKERALRARERRWDSLTPVQARSFSVRGPSGVYELQEGILLMCEEDGAHEKPYTIRLIPLPSVEDPDLEDPIVPTKSFNVGFPIADLTMDPTQDLIVVSEFEPEPARKNIPEPAHRYHFFTMSTFEKHPLAAQPFIDFPPVRVPTEWPRQLIQVMGDTLVAHISREGINIIGVHNEHALVSNDSEEEIVAWNWKTGEVLSRIHLGRTSAPCTFCMLTPTTIAVARSTAINQMLPHRNPLDRMASELIEDPAFLLISFAQRPGQKVETDHPLVANADDHTTPRANVLTRLRLPELAGEGVALMLDNFHMRPDPAFPPVPSGQQTLGRGKPFTQNPSRGVIVTELWINSDQHQQRRGSYELFVLRETLVKMAEEGEARLHTAWAANKKFEMLDLPWKKWGEENARLMPQVQETRRPWVCSCSGYRLASFVSYESSFGGAPWARPEVEDPEDPIVNPQHIVQLVVHDFNPHTVARDRAERKRRGGEAEKTSSWVVQAERDPEDEDNAASNLADYYTVTLWDAETRVPADGIWAQDVVTRLPFRTVRRGLEIMPNGVMIDAERILAMRTSKLEHFWNQRHDITVLCL